ncbi:MAG: hypothetical protein ACSHYF_03855 [Verrucomicrobiaceae bacterium]
MGFGAGSLVEMILGLTQDRFMLNAGVFLIPVGYGVLIGRESSLGWLKIWHGIGLISCILGLCLVLFKAADWKIGVLAVCLAGGFCWSLREIRTRSVKTWFADGEADEALMKGVRIGAVILGVVPALLIYFHERKIEEAFYINTRVSMVDEVTGEFLNHVETSGSRGKDERVTMRTSSRSEPHGLEVDFRGIVFEPYEVSLGSRGYEPQTIVLDEDSKEKMILRMTPLRSESDTE